MVSGDITHILLHNCSEELFTVLLEFIFLAIKDELYFMDNLNCEQKKTKK